MNKSPTSIKLDPQVKAIVELIGISYQRIFDRGLVGYALDGKIKDPKILAAIKKRQDQVVVDREMELETERMVQEMVTRFINNHNGIDENQVIISDQICPYCNRNLKNEQCTCQEWRTWNKLRG